MNIFNGSDRFEVTEAGSLVVSGKLCAPTDGVFENKMLIDESCDDASIDDEIPLTTDDVYKELRLRGYEYGPTFQGILSASNKGMYMYLFIQIWNKTLSLLVL